LGDWVNRNLTIEPDHKSPTHQITKSPNQKITKLRSPVTSALLGASAVDVGHMTRAYALHSLDRRED
jgi:hypothetical protein